MRQPLLTVCEENLFVSNLSSLTKKSFPGRVTSDIIASPKQRLERRMKDNIFNDQALSLANAVRKS
jgi:hypothetical protein